MRKIGFKGALGILVSVVCLYIAFRNFDFADAVRRARQANYWLLALSVIVGTFMFPLRARRWRTILDPIVPKVPFGPLWRATAIGVMLTNVLPARAGELARPFALSREVPAVPFATGLASVAVDRVFDAIVVLLLLAISMVAPGFPKDVSISGHSVASLTRTFAVGPIILLLGLYALVFFPERLIRIFELLAHRVSPVIERRGAEILRRFAQGLSVLRNPAHFIAVFLWTLAHWLVQPLAFWLGFKAFGIDVPWSATLFVQGVIVLAVALPSSPGFFGLFEQAAKIGLAVYGVNETLALTWGVVFHLLSLIPITLFGAYYFVKAGMSMGEISSANSATSSTGNGTGISPGSGTAAP